MPQMYGIDLASEKFDVSFLKEDGQVRHKIVKNTKSHIEKFLDTLPDVWLIAEHTGVYGDMLLYLANLRGIRISYVSGYQIKHSSGLTKGKSDKSDASMIREYGERYADKLVLTEFPSDTLYRLKELFATRRLLVQQRKQLLTLGKGDEKRPLHDDKAKSVKDGMVKHLNEAIDELEDDMHRLIIEDDCLKQSFEIAQSVPGIGKVTSAELIIKTENFKRIPTARKCASLAGIAPFPNSTGKCDKGNHVSRMGDKELKTLLFMCAHSAAQHFEKMRVYKMKKGEVERKHFSLS